MNETEHCPKCEKGVLKVHADGRICGCVLCWALFRYPSMEPFVATGERFYEFRSGNDHQ